MSDLFLVGNGAGFSGDRIDAPVPVVRSLVKRGLPAAMFFECLGERTVALAQLERRRTGGGGGAYLGPRLGHRTADASFRLGRG